MSRQLMTIATFATAEEAHLARNVLRNEGVVAYLDAENVAGALGLPGSLMCEVKLQVAEGDAQRATEVLAQEASLPPDNALPATEDSDKEEGCEEEVAPDDPMAWRAFLTAMVGVPLVPPLLHLYSAWLLARIVYRGFRLSRAGREHFWLSALLDSVVFLFVGWLLGWGKAGFVWGW